MVAVATIPANTMFPIEAAPALVPSSALAAVPPPTERVFPTWTVDPDIVPQLKPHQHAGVDFIMRHFCSNPPVGCVIADSMGLGKTLQTLAAVEMILRPSSSASSLTKFRHPCVLVLTPNTVLFNWKAVRHLVCFVL
jgi:SNF2 family DNA or RNA helicase